MARTGFARFLSREATDAGLTVLAEGPTWVLTSAPAPNSFAAHGLCFAHTTLVDAFEIKNDSVNATARAVLDYFLNSCRDEKFEKPWPRQFLADETEPGLKRRAAAVEHAFQDALVKRMARVAHLAAPHWAATRGNARGLFAVWRDFENVWIARDAIFGGQRRMADDPAAPSRSYLKLEEAYGVLGREPRADETVVDLGAAPGGWSFSAAKHGAIVLALDNGPLKGGALNHPRIQHERADAFPYTPIEGQRFDWLLCDVVDDPQKVLALLERWVAQRWCRRFVVNLKFGRTDPLPLLRRATSPSEALGRACSFLLARHLFHDREEFTLVGELRE